MIHRIFIILLLLMWLPDYYLYTHFIRSYTNHHRYLRILFWLPSVILTLALIALMFGDNFTSLRVKLTGIYMMTYLTIIVPKCLMTLFSLIGKLCASGRNFYLLKRRKKWPIEKLFNILGLIIACTGACIIIYGYTYGWRRFEIKEVTINHSDIPNEFDGYRIVQISDFHLGTIAHHPSEIRKVVGIINAQKPDLIAITGDLVNNEANELNGLDTILHSFNAKDGVFSVLGNHDYGTYRKWPNKQMQINNLETLKRRQYEMGWHLLLNENYIINRKNDSIAIIGVENVGNPPFPNFGNLPRAIEGTEGVFKILLSHDPSHWRKEVIPETDIQLMLAGHTHAMQFELCNFSPSAWIYPEWGGLYTEGNQNLYVNTGLGSVMIPFRFGAWPEISVITLQKNRK